jgi:hypothetical protein
MTQQWSQLAFALSKLVILPIRAEMERKVVGNRLLCMIGFQIEEQQNSVCDIIKLCCIFA